LCCGEEGEQQEAETTSQRLYARLLLCHWSVACFNSPITLLLTTIRCLPCS
jgi:hypothetical protein